MCAYCKHLLRGGHVMYGVQHHNHVEGGLARKAALRAVSCTKLWDMARDKLEASLSEAAV